MDKKLTPREIRLQIAKDRKEKTVEVNDRKEFHKFFIKLKRQLKLKEEMEEILWLHLEATGNDKKENFNNGIKNFGYKI